MTARILIVDDLEINLRVLEARLTAEYYDVVTATSGAAALEICRNQSIDLVLLDVMMPRMDGWGVLRELKAKPETADIPVVMLTALTDVEHMDRGARLGNDCYLTKPFDPSELLAIVGRLLASIDELGYFGDPPADD